MSKQIKGAAPNTRVASTGTPALPPSAQQGSALKHEPTPFFFFKHHPNRWGLVGGEFLPLLSTLPVEAGVSGVTNTGDYHRAVAHAQQRGWTVLPHDCAAELGIESYVIAHKVAGGRVLHASAWETPIQVGSQSLLKSDLEGYKAFLRHLIARGYIAPPDEAIVEQLADNVRRRLQETIDSGKRANHAEIKRAELAVIEGELSRLRGEPEPKPSKAKQAVGGAA